MAENNNVLKGKGKRDLFHAYCQQFVRDARTQGFTLDQLKNMCLGDNAIDKIGTVPESSAGDERECTAENDLSTADVCVKNASRKRTWLQIALVVVGCAVLVSQGSLLRGLYQQIRRSKCLVSNNYLLMEATRPPSNCAKLCHGIHHAIELPANVSGDVFKKYAYSGVPIVVRGGAAHWPALSTFSPAFFKSLYDSIEDAYEDVVTHCQFLPFKSEFLDLQEALNMPPSRAALAPNTRPWYFGWSNCSPGVSNVLRHLAPRPSFLPLHSEASALDWIFMGGAGPGASWHLDYVQRPSWQAQVSGTKTWLLRPVPECAEKCDSFSITVSKGDIVLVDTTQWYHTTYIHEGPVSITIGSEYD
ncbi:uncharacterized protein LOC143017798 [Oratosquilla oratoria]|uniref:uncharacterized protein LOC143017798 n=1 Tax=Oratosquilla oratoria TaxID=337810 RepID=UPI003F776C1A